MAYVKALLRTATLHQAVTIITVRRAHHAIASELLVLSNTSANNNARMPAVSVHIG